VPYANFWAWFWVVFAFSFGLRLFTYRANWAARRLGPLGAIFIGLVGIVGTNTLFVAPPGGCSLTLVILLAGMAALVFSLRPRFSVRPVPPLVFWVLFAFHAYFLLAGLISGVILHPPSLLGMSLAMLALALYWHRTFIMPLWRRGAQADLELQSLLGEERVPRIRAAGGGLAAGAEGVKALQSGKNLVGLTSDCQRIGSG
jgi:hypothetical protein